MISETEIEAIRESSRLMVRELGFLEDYYRDADIPHSQCHALMEIGRHAPIASGALGEKLRLDKSTTSRVVAQLLRKGWVKPAAGGSDRRQKRLVPTAAGKRKLTEIHREAGRRVREALRVLSPQERQLALQGVALYARALERARRLSKLRLRPLRPGDNPEVAAIIREVMPEFGASGPGFAIHDPEVGAMYEAYRGKASGFFVLEEEGRLVGGAGFAKLEGGPEGVCELRKMYFRREARGLGAGQRLLDHVLGAARAAGYRECYLETLTRMESARRLYERNGFEQLASPLGNTGHFGCNCWYRKKL